MMCLSFELPPEVHLQQRRATRPVHSGSTSVSAILHFALGILTFDLARLTMLRSSYGLATTCLRIAPRKAGVRVAYFHAEF